MYLRNEVVLEPLKLKTDTRTGILILERGELTWHGNKVIWFEHDFSAVMIMFDKESGLLSGVEIQSYPIKNEKFEFESMVRAEGTICLGKEDYECAQDFDHYELLKVRRKVLVYLEEDKMTFTFDGYNKHIKAVTDGICEFYFSGNEIAGFTINGLSKEDHDLVSWALQSHISLKEAADKQSVSHI